MAPWRQSGSLAALVVCLGLVAGCGSDTEPVSADPPAVDAPVDPTAVRPPDPGPGSGDNWISIEGMSSEAIDVIWSDVPGATAYELSRLDDSALADPDSARPGDGEVVYRGLDTAYVDRALTDGSRYLYMVVAETSSGSRTEPRWREGVAVDDTTPPSAVASLAAERTADGVRVSWEPVSEDYRFDAYDVRQQMADGSFEWIGGAYARDQTAFLDDRADPGVFITYEVIARDFHGNLSAPRRVTVPPA